MGEPQRRLDWTKLLNGKRRRPPAAPSPQKGVEHRIALERDYDRLLFSTPVRRLADKTQVFPLERNDSVRTRLTHSHEVANLARSIGTTLVYAHANELGLTGVPDVQRAIPSLLGAVGLAHDLGNPPFGHQGEDAMRAWITRHSLPRTDRNQSFDIFAGPKLSAAQRLDFEEFEGNAQALRLLTRLQIINDGYISTFSASVPPSHFVSSASQSRMTPSSRRRTCLGSRGSYRRPHRPSRH
ncbi:MAG: dNTP triphosphohydrolase [Bradyrhizobium sp.]